MQLEAEAPPQVMCQNYRFLIVLVVVFTLLCAGCTGRRITRRVSSPAVAKPLRVAPTPALYVLEDVYPSSQREVTSVVMTVSGPVQPLVQRLEQPDQITIDLPTTQLGAHGLAQYVAVNDTRLRTIQILQSLPDKVRITLDLQTIQAYRVVVRSAPHRVIVELTGSAAIAQPGASGSMVQSGSSSSRGVAAQTPPPPPALSPPSQKLRSKPVLVIDPGHGGHDPGAIGPTGLDEKTAVLHIAKELRQLIQREMPQYRVVMTREDDVFIPLGERARIANLHQAQLFVSIHANSSANPEAHGIETWYLSFAASTRAKKIAARENMMSVKQVSMLELILRDMHETDRINQSAILARVTQDAIIGHVASQYSEVFKRGVEGAPFAVLHRTTMPSILVETSFISNAREEARLRTPHYQRALAQGILRGLRQFLQTTVVATN